MSELEELSGTIATLAPNSEMRNEIRTLKQENERLVVPLQQESARHTELESSNELAAARVAEMSKAGLPNIRTVMLIGWPLGAGPKGIRQVDKKLPSMTSTVIIGGLDASCTPALRVGW